MLGNCQLDEKFQEMVADLANIDLSDSELDMVQQQSSSDAELTNDDHVVVVTKDNEVDNEIVNIADSTSQNDADEIKTVKIADNAVNTSNDENESCGENGVIESLINETNVVDIREVVDVSEKEVVDEKMEKSIRSETKQDDDLEENDTVEEITNKLTDEIIINETNKDIHTDN